MKDKPLGKVIQLHSELYRNQIEETKTRIEKFAEDLISDALNIASYGKWQQWNETMKDGVSYHFSEEMLWATDDLNIHTVLNIRNTVLEMMKRIK